MTTRTAHLPVVGFRLPSGAWIPVVAIALAALAILTAMSARGGGDTELAAYRDTLAPVIERHNAAVARWDEFVKQHNTNSTFTLGSYDAGAADASAEAGAIAVEIRAAAAAWASIAPPAEYAEPHALVLEAMELTGEGVAGVAAYFDAATSGDGDYAQAQQALAMIDEAGAYWSQAKSFES